MSPELFALLAIILFVPLMYGVSMVWYFYISKKRGVYIIEALVSIGGLLGIIILVSVGYSADVGDALAALFGAFFLIPVIVGAIVAAVFVKLTIVLMKKEE